MIEPDVFWSDILLGLTAAFCAYLLRKHKNWRNSFLLLSAATCMGAFYHGYINTTDEMLGKTLWTSTLLLSYLASAAFLYSILPKAKLLNALIVGLALDLGWILFISEKFIWALVIQCIVIAIYGIFLIKKLILAKKKSRLIRSVIFLVIFIIIDAIAIYVQQSKIDFRLTISHNTIFHFMEIPALVALTYSIVYYERKI